VVSASASHQASSDATYADAGGVTTTFHTSSAGAPNAHGAPAGVS
jgi:hypothetical protein